MMSPTEAYLRLRAAEDLDALNPAGAGIVSDIQIGLHLDHVVYSRPAGTHVPRVSIKPGVRSGLGRFDQHLPALGLRVRRAFLDADDVADLERFCASCARYFLDLRTVFFSTGCVKRRSTRTVIVCSFLSLVTVPWRIRLGMSLRPPSRPRRRLLVQDGLHARGVPADGRMRAVFSSWPVACWKRRLNASFFRLASWSRSWSGVCSRRSLALHGHVPLQKSSEHASRFSNSEPGERP